MKKQKIRLILELIALTFSYSFFYFILSGVLQGLIQQELLDLNFIESHYLMLDTIFCLVLSIIYSSLYFKKGELGEGSLFLEKRQIFPSLVVALGLMGLSFLWFIFAEEYLGNIPLIADSFESFDETWGQLDQGSYVWILGSVVFLGPLVEELLFRGLIYERLKKIRPGCFPILVSALLFGLWHLEPVQVVYTVIIGLILGFLREKSGGIRLPLLVHVINNLLSSLPEGWVFYNQMTLVANILSLLAILPMLYYLKGWRSWIQPGEKDLSTKA